MALDEGKRVVSLVREDLDRLHQHVAELIGIVGGSIGSAISARIDEPLASVKNHLMPVLDLLAGVEGGVAHAGRRGPGRPRKDAGISDPAPKKRRRGRGGRRSKLNLSAEQIRDALNQAGGVKAQAARVLGISMPSFLKYAAATGATTPAAPPKKRGRRASKK